MSFFHTASYVLSRFAFLMTHVDFAYFLVFVFNDPFGFGPPVSTMDARVVRPADQCVSLDTAALKNNLMLLALWWGTHSTLARAKVKRALGLWGHPIERPLFATIASLVWFLQIHFWKPISDCVKFNVFDVAPTALYVSLGVIAVGTVFILGLLYTLPAHVFGTDRYQYPPGKYPVGRIIVDFPYGISRHPAAFGFLYIYWAVPAYTPSHLLLASFWTVFIVVGTLVFEEGGLRTNEHSEEEAAFAKKYQEYASRVAAFYPTMFALKRTFGFGGTYSWETKKTQ